MRQAILLIFVLFVVFLIIFNPRIAFIYSRPSYIVSCRTEWSAHWWGAFSKGGLLGFYSLENAANTVLANNSSLIYVRDDKQFTLAKSILLEPCR